MIPEQTRVAPNLLVRWRTPMLILLGGSLTVGAVVVGSSQAIAGWAWAGLAFFPWAWLLIPLLYSLPGLALLRLLPLQGLRLGPATSLVFALAASLALPPLLLLLSWPLGLRWGALTVAGYLALSLLVLLWPDERPLRAWTAWRGRGRSLRAGFQGLEDRAALGALAAISVAALIVRLYAIRDLPVGLLGDAYHHTMIAQLLVDNGGLFQSWQPYAPLASFTYHFGFHAQVAMVHWLTGIPVPQAVLVTGQIMNAAAVPLAFLLVMALRGPVWAGVWAALIVAFVAAFPAFYVNWGRYTQLTGQLVLVGVVVAWINLAERPAWRAWALAGIMTAAMMLTHYLVTASAALFVASYLLAHILAERAPARALRLLGWAGATCLLALLLTAPWFWNVLNGYLVRIAASYIETDQSATTMTLVNVTAPTPGMPPFARSYLLVGAALGGGIAGWQRDWRMAVPLLWCLALALLVAPFVVGLPGTGIIDFVTSLSALYLAIPVLAGYALATGQAYLAQVLVRAGLPARLLTAGLLVAMLGVMAWGAGWQSRIVDRSYQLVTPADMRAMAWIRASTAPEARFVVNGFPAYSSTLVAGSDAGWWIPLLTGRQSTLPPITFGSELGDPPEVYLEVTELWALLRDRPLSDTSPVQVDLARPEALAALRAAGVQYVYRGAHSFPGPASSDWIDTALLRASPDFELVYADAGVEIFALRAGQP
jgi:hypothetical protein